MIFLRHLNYYALKKIIKMNKKNQVRKFLGERHFLTN